MRLLLLPLDDRPPGRVFPQRLAGIAGVNLRVAPRPMLGKFLQPGDCQALAEWMCSEVVDADAVILSADMLCYGGLVASRVPDVSTAEALERVKTIRRLKQINPGVKVFCSSTIMRLTITSSDAYRQKWSEPIFRYCQKLGPARRGDADAAAVCSTLRNDFPDELLKPYLAARARNLAVNHRIIEEVAAGSIDHFCLTQEDCAPEGIHRLEQVELLAAIENAGAKDRVSLYPGADEAAMTLLARAVVTLSEKPVTLTPRFWPASFGNAIPPYEDRPLKTSVEAQVQAAGCTLGTGQAPAAFLPAAPIPDPAAAPDEVCLVLWGGEGPAPDGELVDDFTRWLAVMQSTGRQVALVDAARPNGADPLLIQRLVSDSSQVLVHLSAYAGWNTTGNSLGTAIAHAVCLHHGIGNGGLRPLAHYRFLFERLVDDWLYQSEVRGEVNRELEVKGIFPGNMGNAAADLEHQMQERLLPLAQSLFGTHFKGVRCRDGVLEALESLEVRLPWPRTFEVEISARLRVTAAAA